LQPVRAEFPSSGGSAAQGTFSNQIKSGL
jgi:hypothetical protein